MLNSTEHEISAKYRQMKKFLAISLSDVVFIMLINVKMPTIVGILTYMIRIHFVLSCVENGKKLYKLKAWSCLLGFSCVCSNDCNMLQHVVNNLKTDHL